MGSYPPQGSGGGGVGVSTPWTYAFMTADVTKNDDVVLASQSDFRIVALPNEDYVFEMVLWVTAHATPQFRFSFNADQTLTNGRRTNGPINSVANTMSDLETQETNLGTDGVAKEMIKIYGQFDNAGTTNNIDFQWAQDLTSSEDTTLHAGSYIRYKKIN